MNILSAPHFHNEEAAYKYVETRIWPHGPVCPHCGGMDRNKKMSGKSTRIGVYKCYDYRKQFTVKIGTIFEASHIPMNVCSSIASNITPSALLIACIQRSRRSQVQWQQLDPATRTASG